MAAAARAGAQVAAVTAPRDDGPPILPGQLGLFGAPAGVAGGERWTMREVPPMERWDPLARVEVVELAHGEVLIRGYGGAQRWVTTETLRRDYRRDS